MLTSGGRNIISVRLNRTEKGADEPCRIKQTYRNSSFFGHGGDKVLVTVFLMNGFQMRGIITGFDAFVVVLDSDGKQQVIYKHAISTVAPLRPVDLSETT